MLLLKKPSHPDILPLVDPTKVGLPHPCCKLLQSEFLLLQANWGFPFSPAQVGQIVTLIFFIVLVVENLWQWGQIGIPGNICPARFRSQLKSFRWEANGG
jgi:hypothetical protein